MIKKISVYDMDGTVIDSSHRYRTQICEDGIERIDLQYWIDNEHKTLQDSLLPLAKQFKEELDNPEVFVIIATARIWCELSKEFAKKNGLDGAHVIARKDRNDTRGGAELKISGLQRLLNLKQFAKAKMHVYEDNASYLKTLCDRFQATGTYIPSCQGH